MEKRTYIVPFLRVAELEETDSILAESNTARGFRVDVDENDNGVEENVQTVHSSIWNR